VSGVGQGLLVAGALLLVTGCRPLAKPDELVALEELRERLREKLREKLPGQPELARAQGGARGEAAHERAVAAWRDADLRSARHHAMVGRSELRTAAALREERALRARIASLWERLGTAQAEEARVKDKLARLEEMVQLYEELAVVQSAALEKKLHLGEVERSRALEQLEQARLSLKMAELVGAARYARKLTRMARTLVARADRELGEDKAAAARATAELAQRKAQAAHAAARPRYLEEQAAAERHAQNQALQRDLAALVAGSRWLSVKLAARGQGGTPRLVVRVLSLFLPLGTRPLPAKRTLLDQLAERLRRYPDHHVVIRGHTSHRAPRGKRVPISRIRARRVADHLVAAGLSRERFLVRGEGAARLIASRRSSLNDRVEICVLLR
jgi:outer membrane protein OmpA-like peptidoglycan-associated protein